jgi:hypothetical protein
MAGPTNTFIRDSLQDDGSTPNYDAFSYYSPDICPQTQAIPSGDLASKFTTPSAYALDPGENIELGSTMFLYMRAKNPTGQDQLVTMHAAYVFNNQFVPQSQWQLIGTRDVTVPAGQVAVTDTPLTWTVPSESHYSSYCLVYWLSGNGLPSMPDFGDSYSAYWNAMKSYNIMATRNVYLVDDYEYDSVTYDQALQNSEPAEKSVLIRAICAVPVGSVVNIYCPDPQVGISKSQTTTTNPQTLSAGGQVPADYNGKIEAIVQIPNGAPAGTYGVQFEINYFDPPTSSFITVGTENIGITV